MLASPFRRRWFPHMLAATMLGAVLSACVSVRVPRLPTGDLPAHWRNAASQPGPKPDLTSWWKRFHDPELDGLVDRALHDNLDVAQAAWKLRAARALEDASAATFKPRLAFNTTEEPNPENTASYFQAGFDATWELGLFGRRDANGHLAAANTGAAEAELQSARVSLVAEVVREYLQLRAAQRSAVLLDEAAQAARKRVELLRIQQRLQLTSQLEVERSVAAAAKTEGRGVDPRAAIARHAQALALLLGRSEPDSAWLASEPLPKLAAGNFDSMPANLLRTRPEIRHAEAQVLQAAGELGIAQTDLYPRLALGSSLTFAALVKGQTQLGDVNDTFAIGPIIDIPLFDWGQRRALRDARADDLQAALIAYRQAVLQGAAEVESDLAALHASDLRLQFADAGVAASQQGFSLNEKLRALGQADGLQLADAKLALAESELDRVEARLTHGLAFVALYKALGGAPLPTVNPEANNDREGRQGIVRPMRAVGAGVQGEDGRLRDASGIACPSERPAKDGRAGAPRQGWRLARPPVATTVAPTPGKNGFLANACPGPGLESSGRAVNGTDSRGSDQP